MGRHVIIGKGNLAVDLKLALEKNLHDVTILTASEGFRCPESIPDVLALQPAYVWVTAGHGSVEAADKDPVGAMATHIALPAALLKALPPDCRLGLFSSDYAADEKTMGNPFYINSRPRSLYAHTKVWMEQLARGSARPRTTVFRVCSLYGLQFWDRCLPGRLLINNPTPGEVTVPVNMICPTPTWWIAETIANSLYYAFDDKVLTHHIAPGGGIPVTQFAKLVLGDGYEVRSRGIDQKRPPVSGLGLTIHRTVAPDWRVLWERTQKMREEQNHK